MIRQLVPTPVDPNSAGRDFWNRYHQLRRLRHKELRPDDPFEPDEVVEKSMKKPNPFDLQHYYEISRDGVMVSWFHGESVTPANPEYETNKHLFWADAYVRVEERRKGIATLWLPVIARLMDERGSTVVGMHTDQASGHAFLTWLGGKPKLTDIESRLKLSDVDWSMMQRWNDEGATRSPQTKLEIYDGPLPEAMLPEFAAQRTTLLNTIPFENLDIGDIVVTPEKIRHYYEVTALTGEVPHEVLTRESDGSISGMTDVSWYPYRRKMLEQQFTGVRPDARGRGLGKWIKAAMLLHVRDLYPDAEWVVTENAESNGPMLKINRTMGFKAYRTAVEYQATRDQLESRVRSV